MLFRCCYASLLEEPDATAARIPESFTMTGMGAPGSCSLTGETYIASANPFSAKGLPDRQRASSACAWRERRCLTNSSTTGNSDTATTTRTAISMLFLTRSISPRK